MFYQNQILDGQNVKERSYKRRFLEGKMYHSYSFINVAQGKEEFDHNHSLKNMVEAAVATEIVSSLFKRMSKVATNPSLNFGKIGRLFMVSLMIIKLTLISFCFSFHC
jgi:hypothetical protein